MLLTVHDISKHFGDHEVLRHVSFTLDRGQKLGLVGANGVGKSTLLKIIVGELESDGGAISLANGAELGYLPQTLAAGAAMSVAELFDASLGGLRTLEAELRQLEAEMPQAGEGLVAVLERYSHRQEEFERRGGYELEHRTAAVFAGMGIGAIAGSRPVATLSGGEKSRVGLAALLLRSPDLLILDEPTNHLDFAALEWLEGYLQSYPGGVLVVSHDRQFLNQTVRAIVELQEHDHTARHYAGSYDFYAATKESERAEWEKRYEAYAEEMWQLRRYLHSQARAGVRAKAPQHEDKFYMGFKDGRMSKLESRNVRAAEEKLRRLEENPVPRPPRRLNLNPNFDPAALVSSTPLAAFGLRKGYGSRLLLDGVELSLQHDSRVAVVGPNGAGKTTLLRLLAGLDRPDEGDIFIGGSVRLGYLDQEQETLDAAGTLFDAYRRDRTGEWEEIKAELLGYGFFTWPDLLKPAAALSAGQKRKLQLALLMSRQANLLLLDEPTNHLSLDVLEEFERALLAFHGPIVAVSHDRRFIQRFANEIWILEDGRIRRVLGGWERWRQGEAGAVLTKNGAGTTIYVK